MSGTPFPTQISPMLARPATPFDSDQHVFEIKWDGTRCIALVERGSLRLHNRRFAPLNDRYPELACLAELPSGTALDGEIVVLQDGKPSFSKWQQRDHVGDPRRIEMLSRHLPCTLMVFDLLYHRRRSIMDRPLTERRQRLQEVITKLSSPHVLVSEWVVEHGIRYFEEIQRHGLEGVVAKRAAGSYRPGKRSDDWLKIKVPQVGEFEIIGFVPRDEGRAVSALVLGMWYRKRLIYKGKVGSGFTERQRAELYRRLVNKPPLDAPPTGGPGDAVWRASGLSCRVRFFEKTKTGMLRGPVFDGLVDRGG